MHDVQAFIQHIPAALLVIVRIGGMMMFAPMFSSPAFPVRVRVFAAFLIGLATYPLLAAEHFAGLELKLDIWTLAPLVAMEALMGAVIGFLASLPILAMETGGLIMGQQMGLGFARFYNPAVDDEADIIGQMLFFMAIGLFLMVGGHESLVLAVLHSFEHVRVGAFTADFSILNIVTGTMLASLELALRVAAPLLALVFLETVAMGFLAKTVPQLNILSLGFPLRILLGLAVVGVGLTVIGDVAFAGMQEFFNSLYDWLASFSHIGGGENG